MSKETLKLEIERLKLMKEYAERRHQQRLIELEKRKEIEIIKSNKFKRK